jgi:hypothetical protein
MYIRNISVIPLHPHVSECFSAGNISPESFIYLFQIAKKNAGPSVHLGRRHEFGRGSEKSAQQQNVGAAKIAEFVGPRSGRF